MRERQRCEQQHGEEGPPSPRTRVRGALEPRRVLLTIAPMSDAAASAPWTVRRLLEWTSGFFTRKELDSPRLAAELLLAHVLSVGRIKLYTDYERPVGEPELATFRALVQRAG